MATTAISVKWRDVEGLEKTEVLFFDVSDVDTVAKAQTQLTKYELLLEDISGAVIVEANVTFGLTVSAVATPDVGYSVRAGAYLSFQNSDNVGDGIYIPAVLNGFMTDDVLNDDDTEPAALIAAMLGTGSDGEEPLSTRGSASLWTAFRGGKGASRKVKKH
jgi:hypothetical protein